MDQYVNNMYYPVMDILDVKLHLIGGHRSDCPPDWSWDSRVSAFPGFNLWLIARGRGVLQEPERCYELRPGDCFLLRDDVLHLGSHDPRRPLLVPFVIFDGADARSRRWLRQHFPVHRRLHQLRSVQEMVERCVVAHQEGHSVEAGHWLRSSLLLIAEADRYEASSARDPHHADIERLQVAIADDPGQNWTIAGMAAKFHLSDDHFARRFKTLCGQSPMDFVITRRMERACELLWSSSLSIGRIAELCGYRDQFFFSKQFTKRNGVPPSRWRSAHKPSPTSTGPATSRATVGQCPTTTQA
jgi:AraC-like DNA-binding protein